MNTFHTFVDAFLAQVQAQGSKPAVMDIYGADTYATLNRRSALLARRLLEECRKLGTDVEALRKEGKSGARIAVLLPRTREYMTAVVAVIRAGCALLPIDSSYPKERVATILRDAESRLCVTTAALAEKVESFPTLLIGDVFSEEGNPEADETLNLSDARIEGLLLFTSGSTGKPKGVLHRQSIFSQHLAMMEGIHSFTPRDVTCCMAGFTFIAAEVDLFTPLMTGGSVYIANEDERQNADMLFSIIQRRHVTGMFLPPQMFSVMRELFGRLPLQYVILAGEKVQTRFTDDGNLYEAYGSTETFDVTIRPVSGGDSRLLGKPIRDVHAYLVDDEGGLIREPGGIGELCVVSPWIAEGYLGLPKETADRFVPCPFEPGERMYRTGDYMAWDESGNLLFHGRKDRMVKLRGFRVELGEVENVMRKAPGVQDAACYAVKASGGEKLCCCYLGEKTEAAVLSAHAKKTLPAYMVPDYFIWMEQFPRNERQKVDYLALARQELPGNEGEYTAPEGKTEEAVCEAFAAALHLPRVSATADFFDLGGTSLSVAVLIARLKDLGSGLSFQDVTRHPTPRALAAFLGEPRGEEQQMLPMDRDFYPLTKTQMGIYLEALTGGSSSTYTTSYLMQASPALSAGQLIGAVKAFVSAHPSVKYVIRAGADGVPHMFMAPEEKVEVPVVDGKADDRLAFMQRFMPVVPMTDSLLFHFAVYRTEERCYLALKSHLIFLDGTSISLIIDELNRALAGKPLLAEEYTIQQMGMYEEQKMRDGSHEAAREYHAGLFKEMDDLPPLMGDLEGKLTPGVSENLRYEPGTLTVERVKQFCEKNQITESSFFLGAMGLMLGKYLNSRHVSFSTVYNGRALAGTENTIGTLIKRIPVYANLSRDLPVGDYLRGLSRQVFSNMSQDIYSFDEVLKECPVNEDVEFIYQGDQFTDNMGTAAGETLIEGDKWFMEHYHTGMVTGCLSIQFFSTGGLYNTTIEYRNEKFSESWTRRFAQDLFTVAERLLTCGRIGEISLMTDADWARQAAFNDTAVPMPFRPVHAQIHDRALLHPDKAAVVADGKKLTFRELDALSNRLAALLVRRGVGADQLVGVLFDREVWAYVAEIAILKAGAGFMPFIPEYPDERIRFCMRDSDSRLLLSTRAVMEGRSLAETMAGSVLTLEEAFGAELDAIEPAEYRDAMPEVDVSDNHLAYCIYTSGSTGKPKGVMIEHKNIANYVHRNEKSIEIMHYAAPGRVSLALASFSFDVSVVEEFVPLCNGHTVVIATEAEIHEPAQLARLIRENGINGITCTPTYLLSLLEVPACREAIRQLTFFDIGAEAFPRQLYDRLRELREDSVILNVYGPTECTMGCAAALMTGEERVTVGPPIANTAFYVADLFGNALPVGLRGELIICGDQVGRGYVNLPEKSAAAFFTHDGRRAYHSGDLAAWTQTGEIRIFGRLDNQIKLRGFRIELDEIEKVMAEFPGVGCCAVAVRKFGGREYLAGYYTRLSDVSDEALKRHMQEKLPEYMVPSVLVPLDEMPMTANGKVNRKALPEPDFQQMKAEYIPPETETQKKLCAAFAGALNLPESQVGLLDDFFDLGGDSLKAILVLSQAELDGLTGADVFHLRTPGAIAEALEKRIGQESLEVRDDKARAVPHMLTPMQLEMIDNQLFRPGSTMWSNTHFLLRFGREVDAQRLCDAVNAALENHPGLSVAFCFNEENELRQRFVPGLIPKVKVRDILPETEDMLSDILVLPFNRVLNACLCKVNVFRGQKGCYLFMDVHHLLMDGASLGVVLQDIVNAYFGRPLKRDYYFALMAEADQAIAGGAGESDRKSFMDRYSGTDWCVALESDDPNGSINQAGRIRRLKFDAEAVRSAEERWGVTLSVMAIAAGLVALSRSTGERDVMVNWIFNNRLAPESANTVGMLIKNMPAALRMDEISSMQEALLSVKDQVAWAIAHSAYDFMANTRQPYVNDCMEVNLQMGINGEEMDELPYELVELDDPFSAAGARLELELLENEYKDGGYDSEMEYAEGMYRPGRMEAFHDLYIRILESIVTGGDADEYIRNR